MTVNLTEKYNYKSIERKDLDTGRVYVVNGTGLPSVTTILSKTKPLEDKKKLQEWKDRVGLKEAERISKEASDVGTIMHNILENWIFNKEYNPGNNLIHQQAKSMAEKIKENISVNMTEVWGSEVQLYYPDLYAGTADVIGVWKDSPAIMDFKQANKPKKKEWISDYFLQAAAYSLSHNELYGTDINQCCIFMCSRNLEFQLFEVNGSEFQYWKKEWANRVDKYYKIHNKG
ncbi:MAG: hypothetical protein ACOCT9_02005 [archaeon]